MPIKNADATWRGHLRDGDGTMSVESGAYEGEYTFARRFSDEPGTNPEELIGAAHAGCFSMKLAGDLGEAGYDPEQVDTEASVHLEEGTITRIDLVTEARVPEIDDDEFQEIAESSKENCPVSGALQGGSIEEIALDATLTS